jgi:hypothetical protein
VIGERGELMIGFLPVIHKESSTVEDDRTAIPNL